MYHIPYSDIWRHFTSLIFKILFVTTLYRTYGRFAGLICHTTCLTTKDTDSHQQVAVTRDSSSSSPEATLALANNPEAILANNQEATLANNPEAILANNPEAILVNNPEGTLVNNLEATLVNNPEATLVNNPEATLVNNPEAILHKVNSSQYQTVF